MTGLEGEFHKLSCRKEELEDWLDDVNVQIETIQTEIAKQNKIIRHQDFIVTVDPPTGTWVVKVGVGTLVTHKLSGLFVYSNIHNSQHLNKSEAYTDLITNLKQLGWTEE